ncbi:MAG: Gfo/Idh/MocA family protein [Thermomicrobiales bacterium]
MIKIGIIGSDNSHALAFSRLANVDRVLGDRVKVVGIWGADPERTREVARDGGIATIVERPEDLLDAIDLAVVVDRHGDLHAGHALPFLERGIPTFVDKPLAIQLEDCQAILAAAQRTTTPVTSFSALRWASSTEELAIEASRSGQIVAAHFSGPCDFESPHGGAFFYATHIIELAMRLLGEEIVSVSAQRNAGSVVATMTWREGEIASFSFLRDAAYHFHATLFGSEGLCVREIAGGDAAYSEALNQIVLMAETGREPLSHEQLLQPIEIVHAILESLATEGNTVRVR